MFGGVVQLLRLSHTSRVILKTESFCSHQVMQALTPPPPRISHHKQPRPWPSTVHPSKMPHQATQSPGGCPALQDIQNTQYHTQPASLHAKRPAPQPRSEPETTAQRFENSCNVVQSRQTVVVASNASTFCREAPASDLVFFLLQDSHAVAPLVRR